MSNLINRIKTIEIILNRKNDVVIPDNIQSLSDNEINILYANLQSVYGIAKFPIIESFSDEKLNEMIEKIE